MEHLKVLNACHCLLNWGWSDDYQNRSRQILKLLYILVGKKIAGQRSPEKTINEDPKFVKVIFGLNKLKWPDNPEPKAKLQSNHEATSVTMEPSPIPGTTPSEWDQEKPNPATTHRVNKHDISLWSIFYFFNMYTYNFRRLYRIQLMLQNFINAIFE